MPASYPLKVILINTPFVLTNNTNLPQPINTGTIIYPFADPNFPPTNSDAGMVSVEQLDVKWSGTPFNFQIILPRATSKSRVYISNNGGATNTPVVYSGMSDQRYNKAVNTNDVGLSIPDSFFRTNQFQFIINSQDYVVPPNTTLTLTISMTLAFYIYTGGT